MKYLLRFLWFLCLLIGVYIIIPLAYLIGWVILPSLWKFKLPNIGKIRQDVRDSDWQECSDDPYEHQSYGDSTCYKDPFDFLLKRDGYED